MFSAEIIPFEPYVSTNGKDDVFICITAPFYEWGFSFGLLGNNKKGESYV